MELVKKIKKHPIETGVIALALFGTYKLLKAKSQPAQTVDNVNNELKASEKKYPASLPPVQYRLFADQMQSAMDDQGTDEATIFKAIQAMKNNTDILKLFSAFGVRQKYEFGIPTYNGNLAQWLQDELTTDEIETVNKILQAKKISYRL